ncbi:MAG TPA: sulfite exporter TauE/SafE family protein [Longimicrobiales bacterium]
MSVAVLLTLFGVGLLVGLVSGLIGIGGGVLIVPFLYAFYAHPAWSGVHIGSDVATTVAHATSLFIIVPTAIRGTLSYHRAGLVEWRAAMPIALASVASAIGGALLAVSLPQFALKVAFGTLLMLSGTDLLRDRSAAAGRRGRSPVALWKSIATGLVVGLFSALLGIGGGAIAIPLLLYVIGVGVREVAATSLAIVMCSALAGTLTYAASRPDAALPEGTFGYVHLLAALPILAGSVLAVRWGALLNQRLPARSLRTVFALVFILLGLRLVLLNAPLLF